VNQLLRYHTVSRRPIYPAAVPEPLDRLLTRAGAALARYRRTVAAEHGVSAAALDVLGALTASPPSPSQRDLAARLGVTPPTLTAVLDELERAGLARRVRDGRDRRLVRVEATATGAARCGAAAAALADRVREVLPQTDQDVVRRYLSALLSAVGRAT
jgi:DNA-binding MarR family transcriptional regulator